MLRRAPSRAASTLTQQRPDCTTRPTRALVDLHHRRQRRLQRGRTAHPAIRRDRRLRGRHHRGALRRRIVRLGEGGDTSASGLLSPLVGSEGTLGVITEVLLRLIPAPRSRSTLAAPSRGWSGQRRQSPRSAPPASFPQHSNSWTRAPSTQSAKRAAATSAATAVPCSLLSSRVMPAPLAPIPRPHAPRSPAPALRSCSARRSPARRSASGPPRKAVSAAVAKVQIGKVNEDVVVPRDRVAELVAHTREARRQARASGRELRSSR